MMSYIQHTAALPREQVSITVHREPDMVRAEKSTGLGEIPVREKMSWYAKE